MLAARMAVMGIPGLKRVVGKVMHGRRSRWRVQDEPIVRSPAMLQRSISKYPLRQHREPKFRQVVFLGTYGTGER